MLIEETSLARYLGAMLAVMIMVSGTARAEPAFSFDATPGKRTTFAFVTVDDGSSSHD